MFPTHGRRACVALALVVLAALWPHKAHAQEPRTLEGHHWPVKGLAFTKDGKTLATAGGMDCTVKLWEVATGKELATFKHQREVWCLLFSKDDKTLMVTTQDPGKQAGKAPPPEIKLWDVLKQEEIASFKTSRDPMDWDFIHSMALSSDGKVLLTGADVRVRLWDLDKLAEQGVLEDKDDYTQGGVFALAPQSNILAVPCAYGRVNLWDVAKQEKLGRIQARPNRLFPWTCVALSPDGKTLATAGLAQQGKSDADVKLWDVVTQKEGLTLVKGSTGIRAVAFSPDGKMLVTVHHWERTLKLWDVTTGKELASIASDQPVEGVAFDPAGKILVAGCAGRGENIKLWEVEKLLEKK